EIADGLQFPATGRGTPARVESLRPAGLRQMGGGQRAGANGLMDSLDLRDIDAAAGIPDQQRARHLQLRDGLPAAGGNRACSGREDLATFQELTHARMVFELLERLEGREARILIVEADDESHVRAIR